MRYLGIDYGTKRTGIALSDADGSFAFPADVVVTDVKLADRMAVMAKEIPVDGIVVGDSRALSGQANDITAEVDAFIEDLARKAHVPVHRMREAWSSQEARRFAPPGARHDDSAAAAIILQRYLDQRGKV